MITWPHDILLASPWVPQLPGYSWILSSGSHGEGSEWSACVLMPGRTAEVLGLGVECPLSERVEGLGPSTKLGSGDCAWKARSGKTAAWLRRPVCRLHHLPSAHTWGPVLRLSPKSMPPALPKRGGPQTQIQPGTSLVVTLQQWVSGRHSTPQPC